MITSPDLHTRGFVTVEYPPAMRKAVTAAIEAWKKFTELPLDIKKGLPYSNSADGVGYEFKDGSGTKGDRKENFDVTFAGKKWLGQNSSVIQEPKAVEFVETAAKLVGHVRPIVVDFAQAVENEYGITGLVREVQDGNATYFVRFIHYFGDRKIHDETAAAHTDQSGFTLHLFESHAGLQCLSYEGEWMDMPVSEGETVIIPAMQLQYRSKGKLRALCHRVIANERTAVEGRYSAVCFVQFSDTPKYNKERHGRLQEKVPGFNYRMPIGEFSKLFKQS